MSVRIFLALLWLICLTATAQAAQAATTFSIGWTPGPVQADNSNAPTSFKVYRNGALATTVQAPTVTADIVVNDPPNTQECFTVSAVNTAGESAQSNPPVCGTVPTVVVVPAVPGNVVIIKIQ